MKVNVDVVIPKIMNSLLFVRPPLRFVLPYPRCLGAILLRDASAGTILYVLRNASSSALTSPFCVEHRPGDPPLWTFRINLGQLPTSEVLAAKTMSRFEVISPLL